MAAPTTRAERDTSSVFLRLPPDAAIALRTTASVRGLSHSEYVAGLVLGQESATTAAPSEIGIAEVSRLAHAVHQLPGEVKHLRGELGRQGGLVKHLMERGLGEPYSREASEALRTLQAAATAAELAVEALLDATAMVRNDLERAARILASR